MKVKDVYSGRCGYCRQSVAFSVLTHHEEAHGEFCGYDEDGDELSCWSGVSDVWLMARCPDCSTMNLLSTRYEASSDSWRKPKTHWPARSRLSVEDTHLLSDRLRLLVDEFFKAEGCELYSAAAMILRSVADCLVEELNGIHLYNFEAAVSKAAADGKLSSVQAENLKKAFDLGSAAMHRGHYPSWQEVDRCWSVIREVLDVTRWNPEREKWEARQKDAKAKMAALEAEEAAGELLKTTPPKPPKTPKEPKPQAAANQ